MHRGLQVRVWVETVLAGISGFFLVLTILWHDWIEAFGIEPDGGNGALEWLIVAIFVVATVVFALLARADWRRVAATRGT